MAMSVLAPCFPQPTRKTAAFTIRAEISRKGDSLIAQNRDSLACQQHQNLAGFLVKLLARSGDLPRGRQPISTTTAKVV
jgi:hypothetical protein